MKFKRFLLFLIIYFITVAICFWIIYYSNISFSKLQLYSWIISIILCMIGTDNFVKWIIPDCDKEKNSNENLH